MSGLDGWRQELYELGELAECVELKKLTQKERQTGFGRNCTLFDNARIWAYEAVRDYRNVRAGFWEQAVLDHALSQNTMFAEPLPYSEVKATAKSIARYCLKHDSQCYNKFVERQSKKGRKGGLKGDSSHGGLARSAKYADKRVIAVEMSLRGYSVADIARYFKVDKRQIRRWLSVTI